MFKCHDTVHTYGSTQTIAKEITNLYSLPYDLHGIFNSGFFSQIGWEHHSQSFERIIEFVASIGDFSINAY